VERIKLNEQEEGPESEAIRTGRPAYPRDNLAESGIAEAPALVRLTLYWVQDSEAAGAAAGSDESGPLTGRFRIAREVARPYSQDEIYKIESLRVEYQDPGVSETRREQIKAAAGDYAASWVQGQWSVTWWETPQNFPLSQAADLLNGSAEWLRGLVEHPLADMASRTGAGGPIASIGAGVTANFVTARLTAPLESGARLCEIAGIVLGVMTGAHPLVMACAKRLVDDELSDMLAKGFEQIINAIGTDRGQAVDKRSSLEATGPTDSNIARSERLRRAQERAGIIDIQSGEGVGPAGGPVASRSAKKSQSPYGGIDAV
jgi:hypothetical protein